MTERKPAGMAFPSWIDQQIADAQERGAFDDLPGTGKPLRPGSGGEFDPQAWARDWVRREGGSPEDCLPTPLRLRKELERLDDTVLELRSEQEVLDLLDELNQRIVAWRRMPVDGPPIFVPLADGDAVVARWREAAAARLAAQPPPADPPAPAKAKRMRRTWRRRPR